MDEEMTDPGSRMHADVSAQSNATDKMTATVLRISAHSKFVDTEGKQWLTTV